MGSRGGATHGVTDNMDNWGWVQQFSRNVKLSENFSTALLNAGCYHNDSHLSSWFNPLWWHSVWLHNLDQCQKVSKGEVLTLGGKRPGEVVVTYVCPRQSLPLTGAVSMIPKQSFPLSCLNVFWPRQTLRLGRTVAYCTRGPSQRLISTLRQWPPDKGFPHHDWLTRYNLLCNGLGGERFEGGVSSWRMIHFFFQHQRYSQSGWLLRENLTQRRSH